MKSSRYITTIIVETVCLLYVVLFVYAAVSKLLDFENFRVQLGQSPLLSAFAGWVSLGVPIMELLISLLLIFPRFRLLGLYAAFGIMTMFTTYIVIILNFSSFVPCSCGGVLEKLGWTEHLIFNIIFIALAFIAILLFINRKPDTNARKRPHLFIRIPVVFVSSIIVIIVLFLCSEDIIHHRNNFIRRFPKHRTVLKYSKELPYDSYYLAGYDQGHIYLGNRTAPLVVTVIDTTLKSSRQFRIDLPKNNFPFSSPRLKVVSPNFYFTDGTVPCVFSGSISNWKAKLRLYKNAYFSVFEPISSDKAAIRTVGSKSKERVIGIIDLANQHTLNLNHHLLEKQIDGVFDTDGMLLYNKQLDTLLYTYYYRNSYLKIAPSLKRRNVGHTIDTITKAQLKIAKIKSKGISTLASPPLLVNKNTATYGNYLFVDAGLMGQYEPEELWQKASIIDVYEWTKNRYAFSFYIYKRDGQKMREFMVNNKLLIALYGKYLTVEKLNTIDYKPWEKEQNNLK